MATPAIAKLAIRESSDLGTDELYALKQARMTMFSKCVLSLVQGETL